MAKRPFHVFSPPIPAKVFYQKTVMCDSLEEAIELQKNWTELDEPEDCAWVTIEGQEDIKAKEIDEPMPKFYVQLDMNVIIGANNIGMSAALINRPWYL